MLEEKKSDPEKKPPEESVSPELTPMIPGMEGGAEKKQYALLIGGGIVAALILMIPYYFFYQWGYRKGYEEIFKPKLETMQPVSEYCRYALYPLRRIEVNLLDSQPRMYLVVSLHLGVKTNEELSECAARESILRDLVISVVSRFKSSEIASAENMNKLKRLIKDEMNATLSKARVVDVLFSEYRIKILQPVRYVDSE